MANTLNLGNGDWATKENSLLGYNSENGNYKPLPFDFTRASNGTFVNKSGLIETAANGVPRIDFSDSTKGALLLEPQRTNITYPSENFSSQLQGASSTFGTVVSPDGTLNGSTIASTSDGAYKGWHETYSLTNDTYTFSMFVKYYNSQWISIYRIGQAISRFDVKNGVFGNNPSNLKSVDYGNGWYRLEFTFLASSGTNWLYIYPSSDSGETSSLGDGFHIWGGQLEQGSYATSYIPTQGSAVTRVVDSCSQTVPDGIIGQTEGVVYIDFLSVNNFDGNGGNLFEIKEDNNNRINIYFSNGTPRLFGIEDASGVFNQALSLTTGSVCKLAIKYNSTSTKVFINGSLSHTLNGINNIAFSDYSFLPNNNIDYNEIKLYNTALTDAELIALTTI